MAPSHDCRGCEGSHAYGSGEIDAPLSVHMSNHEVHAAYAAGQALRIRKEADCSITVEPLPAIERAENVHPRRLIQRTIAVRHQRGLVGSLPLDDESQKLRREVSSIRNHFCRHVPGVENELHHTRLHRRTTTFSQRGNAAHGAVEMIHVPHAELVRDGHFRPGRVRVSGVEANAFRGGGTIEVCGPRQFRRTGCRQDHVRKAQVLLELTACGRSDRLRMTADLLLGEVGSIEMRSERARQAALRVGAAALQRPCVAQKRHCLLVWSDGAGWDDARHPVTGVGANCSLECLDRAVHEIGVVAAVHVKIDVARRYERSGGVEGWSRPRGQVLLETDRRESAIGNVHRAAGDESIGKNECGVDDPKWIRASGHQEIISVARRMVSNRSMKITGVWFDVRAAWKGVRGGRWASLTAIVALALGIGGAITAAAVAYAGLLRPLPFPHPNELVTLRKVFAPTAMELGIKLAQFDEWSASLAGTARLAAYAREAATVRDAGPPREVQAAYVVGPFFDVLGLSAEIGRTFTEHDAVDVAVVSHAYASTLAGSSAAALDRSFTVAGRPLRIVGVMPRTFSVIGDVDFWTPARGAQALRMIAGDDARYYTMVARLSGGKSVAEFRVNAQAVVQRFAPEDQRASWHARVTTLRDELLGNSRHVLLVFAAASCLVLLIACANVAMLLINLAVARTREFAVRLALGASRARLLRTLFFETMLLVVAGGGFGWWIAMLATAALDRQTELNLPRLATSMDGTPVTAGAIAACLLVILVCSGAPVLTVRHAHLATPLRAGASTGSRTGRRVRGALVVAQLAIAVVLLIGAGLLGRTLWVLSHTNIGLDLSPRVVTMAVPVGQSIGATDAASRTALTDRLLQEVRRLPGVEAAGVGSSLPPSASQILFTVRFTTTNNDRDTTRKFDLVSATDGYLDALGARIVQGRLFTAADTASNLPVAVISESAMRYLDLKGDVTGRELSMSLPSASGQRVRPRIVGVMQDIRYTGLDAPANGAFYVLWRQIPTVRAHLVVRTAYDGRGLLSTLLPIVRSIDPSLPLSEPQLLDDVVGRALAPRTARFGLVGVYAMAAVLLALVGLSGALIRSVVERQRELAVRAALGATPERLVRMVLQQGLGLAASGAAAGVLASLLAGRAASNIIFGVTPYDPVTYAGVLIGIFAIVLIACYLPARRAAAADPIVLLRSE